MPPVSFRSSQNTYATGVTGGTVPTANIKPAFAGWAESVDPQETPITNAIKKSTVIDQRTFFWGQSKFPNHRSTLLAGINNSVTAMSTASGDGVFFQKYDVINIIDVVVGSSPPRPDYTTKETVWVSADPATDALTIVRGQGGTSGVAHNTGAILEIIGTAEPQLQDHVISPVTRGFQYSNFMQRFGGSIKMDKAFRNSSTYEYDGDQLANDIKTETKRLKLLREKAYITGGKQAGNPSTPLPELMGGFLSFITTNVYNQGGAVLSSSGLETAARDLYKKVDDGGPKVWMAGPDTVSIFDTFLNPYRVAQAGETKATYVTQSVQFRWGTYDIMPSRWFPEGVIALVDFGNMTKVTFKGLDWHTSIQPVYGDYDQMSISTDCSLKVENEVSMGLITNFITDLDAYPGRTYLSA